MLPKNFKLVDLYYGHSGKFILSHKGSFNPRLVLAPIQLGQLSCGCWIILDGNKRIGLILKKNPNAIMGDYDEKLFCLYKVGEWDEELMQWWNPYPKTMGEIMTLSKELNRTIRNKSSFVDQEKYQTLIEDLDSQINSENHTCLYSSEELPSASCIS